MNKKLILIAVTAIFVCSMMSCGGSKQAANTPARDTDSFDRSAKEPPCAMYDDEENFAATGFASGDAARKGSLQMTALKNAQDMIAMKMQHAVEGAVKSLFKSIGSNQGTDVNDQTIGGINNIIKSIANNTDHSCLMFSSVDAKGNIECYIGIKISKSKIADAVADTLSKSKEVGISAKDKDRIAKELQQYKSK
jgi:hypothetical protein